ncbi:chemerin-like receptor 1 isoform 2-T4 [Anomaloglossus baeobatrachus]
MSIKKMDYDDLNLTFPPLIWEPRNKSLYEDGAPALIGHGDAIHDYLNILKIVSITLYSIVFGLGIIGNGLVIWIAGFRMKKTISAVWFLPLAIADFLCCASLPLRIVEWDQFYYSYNYSNLYCYLSMILFNLNMTSSVLLLTAMSIDRWVSVM